MGRRLPIMIGIVLLLCLVPALALLKSTSPRPIDYRELIKPGMSVEEVRRIMPKQMYFEVIPVNKPGGYARYFESGVNIRYHRGVVVSVEFAQPEPRSYLEILFDSIF
jgi:hypothetical protein